QQLHRPRASDEDEQVVDENGDDEDVEHVVEPAALTPEESLQLLADPIHALFLEQRCDLRRKVVPSVQQERLDEKLALLLPDVALPGQKAHHVDEQALRVVRSEEHTSE